MNRKPSLANRIDLALLGRCGKVTQYSIKAGKQMPRAERQRAPKSDMKRPRRGTATASTTVNKTNTYTYIYVNISI